MNSSFIRRYAARLRGMDWGLLALIFLGALLRVVCFVGITGARDDENEYRNTIEGLSHFPSRTWPSYNRLALIFPKLLGYRLFGSGDIGAGIYTLATSVLCIALAYAIAKILFGRRAGLIAALLAAVSSFDIGYSSYAWNTDMVLSFWVGATVWLALLHHQKPRIWTLVAGAFCFWLAYRTKTNAAVLVAPLLYLAFSEGRVNRAGLSFAVAGCLVLILDSFAIYLASGDALTDWHATRALVSSSIRPFAGWQDISNALEVFSGGHERQFGLFTVISPLALAACGVRAISVKKGRWKPIFLGIWFSVFFLSLLIMPSGYDAHAGLSIFAHQIIRYYCVVLIPIFVMLALALDIAFQRFPAFTVVLLSVFCVYSVDHGAELARMGRNHRKWVSTLADSIERLPRHSLVFMDEGIDIWLRFKRPELERDYSIFRIYPEVPSQVASMDETFRLRKKAYFIVGGPRGMDTPDFWRLRRANVPAGARVRVVWTSSPPSDWTFDGYYRDQDPSELLEAILR